LLTALFLILIAAVVALILADTRRHPVPQRSKGGTRR
jgi:hypothetical protein